MPVPVPTALQWDAVCGGVGVGTATASLSDCSSGAQPTRRSSSDSTSAKVGREPASAAQQRAARAYVEAGGGTKESARVG